MWVVHYRRLKMPVQMIELEEVAVFEASDEALETIVTVGGTVNTYTLILGGCGSGC